MPVTKLAFGGLNYDAQEGAYKLGNMRCFGKAEVETGSSCSALKLEGITLSGYYDIKKPGDMSTSMVYCDMAQDGYEDIPETPQSERATPIGTIAAWVAKPASGASNTQEIPDGWVFCNNSIIEKGPWAGARTPNLNNGNFLRGGGLDQQLQMEQDQIQDHRHTDPGHTHSASSSSSSHRHSYDDYYIKGGDGSYPAYCYRGSCSSNDLDGATRHGSSSAWSTVSVTTTVRSRTTGISGVSSSYRRGSETRPKNMKVTWIMKCW